MTNKLFVVPLDEPSRPAADFLVLQLSAKFTFRLQTGLVSKLPEESHNAQRNQYFCSVIANKLQLLKGSPDEIILAVTDEDLYLPTENFVYGYADPLGRVAVVSTHRIKPELQGLPPDEELLKSRLVKLAVHQIGHILGLKHCENPECVMHHTKDLMEADAREDKYCPNCLVSLAIPGKVGKY